MITIERIAKTCHAVNRAYCDAIGDKSQVSWEDAPAWQRESATAGVEYLLQRPDAEPGELHDNWARHKVEDGWVYGDVKDVEAKTHPCLVEFDELPRDQQTKDLLFAAVVRACADIVDDQGKARYGDRE